MTSVKGAKRERGALAETREIESVTETSAVVLCDGDTVTLTPDHTVLGSYPPPKRGHQRPVRRDGHTLPKSVEGMCCAKTNNLVRFDSYNVAAVQDRHGQFPLRENVGGKGRFRSKESKDEERRTSGKMTSSPVRCLLLPPTLLA